MMNVTVVSLSSKHARARACRILDQWLWRRAEQTWSGRLSAQALEIVAGELRKAASRNMAVACYIENRNEGQPVFIVGSRKQFGGHGQIVIRSSARKRPGSRRTNAAERLLQAVVLAALFHDIGKSCASFQAKLRAALAKAQPSADPVRHELISALVIDALAEQGEDDRAVLRLLATGAAASLHMAYEAALARVPGLFRANGQDPLKFRMLAKNSRYPFLADVLRLVATHHRLLAGNWGDILAEDHINLDAWSATGIDGVRLAPYPPLWSHDGWIGAVQDAAGAEPIRLRSARPDARRPSGVQDRQPIEGRERRLSGREYRPAARTS
jgi:CRISPR-associated endonuclease/helicase Cas3